MRIADVTEGALYPDASPWHDFEVAEFTSPTCSVGVAVRFERDDEAPDGGIAVTWDAEFRFAEDPTTDPTLTIAEE